MDWGRTREIRYLVDGELVMVPDDMGGARNDLGVCAAENPGGYL